MSAPLSTTAALAFETLAAFDWLAAGLDPERPVSFVPNPGGLGDAAINLACWRWLRRRFRRVEVARIGTRAAHDLVFIGGGGNLVEPLYVNLRRCLATLPETARIHLFPATLFGYPEVLRPLAGRLRVICRDPISLAYAHTLLAPDDLRLGHDAAFSLEGMLPGTPLAEPVLDSARFFRRDIEAASQPPPDSDGDPAGARIADWHDMAQAESAVAGLVRLLGRYRTLVTDRLHVAILGALLGRAVELRANSYFKNQAVFQHSLSGLPRLVFAAGPARASSATNDPLRYLMHRAEPRPRRHGLARLLGRYARP
jgi:exopolysaccharide biosynthesis predicted pyruvyltransferase EpsI